MINKKRIFYNATKTHNIFKTTQKLIYRFSLQSKLARWGKRDWKNPTFLQHNGWDKENNWTGSKNLVVVDPGMEKICSLSKFENVVRNLRKLTVCSWWIGEYDGGWTFAWSSQFNVTCRSKLPGEIHRLYLRKNTHPWEKLASADAFTQPRRDIKL